MAADDRIDAHLIRIRCGSHSARIVDPLWLGSGRSEQPLGLGEIAAQQSDGRLIDGESDRIDQPSLSSATVISQHHRLRAAINQRKMATNELKQRERNEKEKGKRLQRRLGLIGCVSRSRFRIILLLEISIQQPQIDKAGFCPCGSPVFLSKRLQRSAETSETPNQEGPNEKMFLLCSFRA